MAGRIRDEDIDEVRSRVDLVDVVREHLSLRSAGAGSFKGLCPFHDEKTPSFHVRTQTGYFTCFGCGENGDVFAFVMKIESLSFPEAVERLAARVGVELRYEEGGVTTRAQQSQRTRLIAAHKEAAAFYAEQLASPEAEIGRTFLRERGFDADTSRLFGVGYAPGSWDGLTTHLRRRGYTMEELETAGLSRPGNRGYRDRFVGRLVWPIAEVTGDIVGFGARRLREDDPGPKYLNTPETPIYRKSHLLYGADRAKRDIARSMQVVLVEGYTDVMACHLAGVPTAVATCGTAFGEEHVKIVRRLLADQSEFRGEVIFTFDGDEAGQRAAIKAFGLDQQFLTQTFVAVSPDGLDPCDLRLTHGDEAVRDLIATRVPLFEFAIRDAMAHHDLGTSEGRVRALAEAAPIVATIRIVALRPEYIRKLAGWLGLEERDVAAAVRRAEPRSPQATAKVVSRTSAPAQASAEPIDLAAAGVERELLRVAVQAPQALGEGVADLDPDSFTVATYSPVAEALIDAFATNGLQVPEAWVRAACAHAADDHVRSLIARLAVESLTGPAEEHYAAQLLARFHELALTRKIVDLKARLQRINPLESSEYTTLFAQLVSLEQQRRTLRELALG